MSSNAVFSLLKPQFNSLLDPNVKNKREITKQILLDLKGVNSSGKLDLSKECGVLSFPLRYLIPQEQRADSTVLIDLVTLYADILARSRFTSFEQVQVHFEIIPALVGKMKALDDVKNSDAILLATSRFLSALFNSSSDLKFLTSVLAPPNLPLLSAVMFHSLFLLKTANSSEVLDINLKLISNIFTGKGLKSQRSVALGAIFPGLLSGLIETILKRIRSSLVIAESVRILSDLVISFLSDTSDPVDVSRLPVELQKMFPNRSDEVWKAKSLEVISSSVRSVLPSLLSSESTTVKAASAEAIFRLYRLLPDLQCDFLDFLGYCAADDEKVVEMIREIDDEKAIEIAQGYFNNFSAVMRDGNRSVKLQSFYGLIQSINFSDLSCFINLEGLCSKVINYLTPNYSLLPPVIIVEYSNPLERQFSKSQNLTRGSERGQLADFTPCALTAKEFEIIGSILTLIGSSECLIASFEALSDEQDQLRFGPATLGMIFLIKNATSKGEGKELPSQIVTQIVKTKLDQIRTKSDLGKHLLRLHLIKVAFRQKLQQSDFCILLFPLLECCASDYVEVSTLAVEILDEVSLAEKCDGPAELISTYLDSVISLLLCRLRHVTNYPSSPKIFSVILDLLAGQESTVCETIILSAFGEMVKFIDSSNGQKLPFYISALSSLSRYFPRRSHPSTNQDATIRSISDLRERADREEESPKSKNPIETESEKTIRRLLESCSNTIGSNFTPFVTVAMFDVISNFVFHLSEREILPFVAKLFPILLRRFQDGDLRLAQKVPAAIIAVYRASGNFLARRIVTEFLPRVLTYLRKNTKMESEPYSARYKQMKCVLEGLNVLLDELELDNYSCKVSFSLAQTIKDLKFARTSELESIRQRCLSSLMEKVGLEERME